MHIIRPISNILHSSKKGHQGITLVTIILCIKELTEYPYQ